MTYQADIEVCDDAMPQLLPLLSRALHQPDALPTPERAPRRRRVRQLKVYGPQTFFESMSRRSCVRPSENTELPHSSRLALLRQLAANSVEGRIVIEQGGGGGYGCRYWKHVFIIPATLPAIRAVMWQGWVRIVVSPQPADFERATDETRVMLSMYRRGAPMPERDRERIKALNLWAYPELAAR